MNRSQATRNNKKAQKREKKLAKEEGGRLQPNSGSLWGAKGDVKLEHFLVDSKTTKHSKFRMTITIMEKLREEAYMMEDRLPALEVILEDDYGQAYYAVDEYTWQTLISAMPDDTDIVIAVEDRSKYKSYNIIDGIELVKVELKGGYTYYVMNEDHWQTFKENYKTSGD